MPKIFISTSPFGEVDRKPLSLLEETGWEFKVNPFQRKLSAEEVADMAEECNGLIAGTEDLNIVLEKAKKLQIISRVGIGLDSVPLDKCKERNIAVTYTPDAVTMAVAELTIGLMISLTRHVAFADRQIRQGEWRRRQGKRLGKSTIGIIGFGRVGTNVARLLLPFQPEGILINDILDKSDKLKSLKESGASICLAEKKEIYKRADIISLHVPLTPHTRDMINKKTLCQMKKDAFLFNLSRGGIVNEAHLFDALLHGTIAGAAVDCFQEEPYKGPLATLDNILLTQHMGSCSHDCRAAMEIEATKDLVRFFKGESLRNPVPDCEYVF